ncbi:MAG: hypothetical protein FD141_600 [Fusobacteria bacterium]|nr:MAG: hypothetical protein FD141_600 [Fusobacteriota bacterium]KAF0228734.1 MAG: hypothetical protein FD182_990 [Fusobacteriota bacterium]
MKNKWLLLLLPIPIILIIFLINKSFILSINQVSEMLKSSNADSLQMFYYDGGIFGWLVSIAITIYGILIPIFPKAVMFVANSAYFGPILGAILVMIGSFIAAGYLFLIGRWISTLIKGDLEKLKLISVGLSFIISIIIPIVPLSIIGLLISGIISKNSKLGICAIAIGTFIAGLIQILI